MPFNRLYLRRYDDDTLVHSVFELTFAKFAFANNRKRRTLVLHGIVSCGGLT